MKLAVVAHRPQAGSPGRLLGDSSKTTGALLARSLSVPLGLGQAKQVGGSRAAVAEVLVQSLQRTQSEQECLT